MASNTIWIGLTILQDRTSFSLRYWRQIEVNFFPLSFYQRTSKGIELLILEALFGLGVLVRRLLEWVDQAGAWQVFGLGWADKAGFLLHEQLFIGYLQNRHHTLITHVVPLVHHAIELVWHFVEFCDPFLQHGEVGNECLGHQLLVPPPTLFHAVRWRAPTWVAMQLLLRCLLTIVYHRVWLGSCCSSFMWQVKFIYFFKLWIYKRLPLEWLLRIFIL